MCAQPYPNNPDHMALHLHHATIFPREIPLNHDFWAVTVTISARKGHKMTHPVPEPSWNRMLAAYTGRTGTAPRTQNGGTSKSQICKAVPQFVGYL